MRAEKYSGWLTENSPKSQLACGKLPASGQIETLSLSVCLSLSQQPRLWCPLDPRFELILSLGALGARR